MRDMKLRIPKLLTNKIIKEKDIERAKEINNMVGWIHALSIMYCYDLLS